MKKNTAGGLCQQTLLRGLFFTLLLTLFSACGAGGENDSGGVATQPDQPSKNEVNQTSNIQVSESWDAKVVTKEFLRERNDFLTTKVAQNTVKVTTLKNKGTGFYLGMHKGFHIVATSAHVLTEVASCKFSTVFIQFPLAKKVFTCHELIGIWADVDFALMAIKSNASFFKTINPLKLAKRSPPKGSPLMSMGFGNEANSDLNMTLKEDKYCTIFSDTGVIRRISNQDNQRPINIPSMAVGCDFSTGDSGSAIIDKVSGQVTGITWSIMAPKDQMVRSNQFLDQLLSQRSADVWNDLALAVPVEEIRQSLIRWTNKVSISIFMTERRMIVEEILEK